MTWTFEKFCDHDGVFAICPKCGKFYQVGSIKRIFSGLRQPKNCPNCKEYLYDNHTTVEVIQNRRNMPAGAAAK